MRAESKPAGSSPRVNEWVWRKESGSRQARKGGTSDQTKSHATIKTSNDILAPEKRQPGARATGKSVER
jgi:hypothetical protein